MASTHVAIMNDVVTVLNTAPALSQAFTSAINYLPNFDQTNIATLKVFIVPTAQATESATRTKEQNRYTVDVGVAKKVGVETDGSPKATDMAGMIQLVEEIRDRLWTNRELDPTSTDSQLVEIELPVAYDADRLRVDNVFFALLRCQYEVIE